MADNVGITPGSGDKAASRSVTYSGETAQVQIVGLSVVSGPDDAKTVEDVSAAAPLPVRMDQGPGALVTENGALRVDPTQVNEQAQEVLNATGRMSLGDEPLQMVGLHPNFPLPIDTATPMPIAGRDSTGAQRQIAVEESGAFSIPDVKSKRVLIGPVSSGVSQVGRFGLIDTTGYNTVVIHKLTSASSNTQLWFPMSSSDGVVWTYVGGYEIANSSVTASQTVTRAASFNGQATVGNIYIVPVMAKYFAIESNSSSGAMSFWVDVTLRNMPTSPVLPYQFSVRANVNTETFGSASNAWLTAGSNAGVAVGGVTATGSTRVQNPLVNGGVDASNIVRATLLDAAGNTQVTGGLIAGASALLGTTGVRPVQQGVLDGEGRVRHVVGTPRGQVNVRHDDATTTSEAGVIDALNDVVRELKLLNARIADLPYWLGVGAAMPDDASTFRDDPYIFNQ